MSEQPKSMYLQLAESVGPMAKLPNNGASYHSGEQIITHLNRVLGPEHWSFHILGYGMEEDSDECWVFGQITATIDGVTVVKQDYGSQAVKRSRQSGKFISKGEDRKAAATDALKRCARLLGVGLDAWANEQAPSWRPDEHDDEDERREVEAEMRAEKRQGGKPAPSKPDQKVEAAARVTGAPPQPVGHVCAECKAFVPAEGTVNITRSTNGQKIDVTVKDFEPVCVQRLGAFHCAACYDKKYWKVA